MTGGTELLKSAIEFAACRARAALREGMNMGRIFAFAALALALISGVASVTAFEIKPASACANGSGC
jgi:hypothetical protein